MWFKYLIIIVLFWFFAVLQNSFLPYFSIMGQIPNFVFILFFLLVFFDTFSHKALAGQRKLNEYYQGFFAIIIAGFFLDVFLPLSFGFSIIALLIIYLFVKIVNYFFQKSQNIYAVIYFIVLFSICFFLYNLLWYVSSLAFHFQFPFGWNITISLLYSLVFASLAFFIYKKFINNDPDNQLKLF